MNAQAQRPMAGKRIKRQMGVQQALEWAFAVEHARLDLDVIDPESDRGAAVGNEWILMQRAILGCKPDCSGGFSWGGSAPHHDAEVIASVVANLAVVNGGRQMAGRVAEWARTGTTPDWMPGAQVWCEPVAWRQTKHGEFAKTASLGFETVRHRGREVRVEVLWCPVRFRNTAGQIARMRRDYLDWWGALLAIAGSLRACDLLTEIEITRVMPPLEPWKSAREPQ